MMEAVLDVESMAKTSTKVFILEVMGRHAGWITAATGLAQRRPAKARTSCSSPRSRSTRKRSSRASTEA
jgi:6-phosphofructokinase